MALGEHEPRLLDEDRVRQLRDAMDDAAREHMRVTAELLTYVMNRAPTGEMARRGDSAGARRRNRDPHVALPVRRRQP